MQQQTELTLEQTERNLQVATAIKDFLIRHSKWDLYSDTRIYFNNLAWDFYDNIKDDFDDNVYVKVIKNIKASDYFEYADDNSVSVSTEGPFCNMLSYEEYPKLYKEFEKLLEKYNAYFEMGHHWNFTVVFMEEKNKNAKIK